MDSHILASSLGAGFAIGLATMLVATFTAIPASYVMNKFIYHGPVMRLMMGLIAGACSFFAFLVIAVLLMMGKVQPTHYFGLFPVVKAADTSAVPGYLAFLLNIFYIFYHPFIMFFNKPEDSTESRNDDYKGYVNAVEAIVVKGTPVTLKVPSEEGDPKEVSVLKGAVCEEFFEAARKAAFLQKDKWGTYMGELQSSGVGQVIFDTTPGVTGTTGTSDE